MAWHKVPASDPIVLGKPKRKVFSKPVLESITKARRNKGLVTPRDPENRWSAWMEDYEISPDILELL